MELFKHTMIHSLKNLVKLYIWKNRSFIFVILFYVGSIFILPLFFIAALFYTVYYSINYIYVYVSSITKKVLVKTRSTLLALPFILIGLGLALINIVLYFITRWISKTLQWIIRGIDLGKYLIHDEMIFFSGGKGVDITSFMSR